MNTPQSTLEYILKSIIPADKVTLDQEEIDGVTILKITTSKELIGQLIGKEGKVIKSIRSILNLCYPNQRYSIEFTE
jgi:predicted RNA-binding protein YlqC (UPF0109 family)